MRVFEARAINDGPERRTFKRSGEDNGRWYLDIGGRDWRAVEISPDGWTILERHNLAMIRSRAMRPLSLETAPGAGSLELLRPFVNTDDCGFKLVVGWLLGALWPFGPYPILILAGEQGTAKSTLTKLLRNLIDANVAPLRLMPKDEADLMVSASHSRVMALDNVSHVTGEASDILCGIATGAGTSARAKFTDAEEFVLTTKNPIIMNGIPTLTNRPDMASRSLVVQLQPIPEDKRQTEREHSAAWDKVASRVLAGLLDVMCVAIQNFPTMELSRSARMADFERLVEAAAPALGWDAGEFGAIYRGNQDELDSISIEADDLAAAILQLIRDDYKQGWSGTASRLLDLLSPKVSDAVRRSKIAWPQNAVGLGNRLARIIPVLRRHGVVIERKANGTERTIYIVPTKAKQQPAAAPDDDTDAPPF